MRTVVDLITLLANTRLPGLFSAPLGGAGSGLDLMNHLSWYLRGGGRELYLEFYQKILKTDVMAFMYGPDGPGVLWVVQETNHIGE